MHDTERTSRQQSVWRGLTRVLIAFAGVVALSVLGFLGYSYSWTLTPMGRLEYRAALLARLAQWSDAAPRPGREARKASNAAADTMIGVPKPAAGIAQHDVEIGGDGGSIPLRIYIPEGAGPMPVLLNFHGGGFFSGDGFVFDSVPMQLALRARVVVVSVDYRLAPEHPFPAAVDDAYRALEWTAQHAPTYNADPSRLGVMGQSAGANLAAVVALRARDERGPRIAFQYLESPVTDMRDASDWPSLRETGEKYLLKASMMPAMRAAYVPDAADRENPWVSPLLAASHAGLPPTLVVVARFDPLRDQGIAYAHVLERAGIPVTLEIAEGVLHGFIGTPQRALANLDRVQQAMQEAFAPTR